MSDKEIKAQYLVDRISALINAERELAATPHWHQTDREKRELSRKIAQEFVARAILDLIT
jgi:hypothetical protein